jgi:hypothetical protein
MDVHSNVLACGAGRSVKIFDIRKWRLLSSWSECTKNEVNFSLISSQGEIKNQIERQKAQQWAIVLALTRHFLCVCLRLQLVWLQLADDASAVFVAGLDSEVSTHSRENQIFEILSPFCCH